MIAIQGALRDRDRTGRGCEIDIGLADAVWPLQSFQVADYGERGYSPGPEETYLNDGAAYYRAYKTRDGRLVALGAAGGPFWKRFCVAAGRPEWIDREADPMPQRALIAGRGAVFRGPRSGRMHRAIRACGLLLHTGDRARRGDRAKHTQARGLVRRAPSGQLQALFPARVDGEVPASRRSMRDTNGGFGE